MQFFRIKETDNPTLVEKALIYESEKFQGRMKWVMGYNRENKEFYRLRKIFIT